MNYLFNIHLDLVYLISLSFNVVVYCNSVHCFCSESKLKENLLKYALKRKQMEMEKGIFRNNSMWDKVVFKQVHQKLGGRVRAIFCGSAPLSDRVSHELRSCDKIAILHWGKVWPRIVDVESLVPVKS